MRFISGLKEIFKQYVYTSIILGFILIWILILILQYVYFDIAFRSIIIILGGSLILFSIILFLVSFLKPVNKMGKYILLIALLIAIIIALIFTEEIFLPTYLLFFIISLNVNLFFTAFFAFKLCIDSATKLDDYLYKKEKSRKFTRIIEFILFGFLNWWFLRATWLFFSNNLDPLAQAASTIFRIIIWVNLILILFVILRGIITKKFAAYITLFFLLIFFYVLYLIFDFIYGVFFTNESGDPIYVLLSFVVDLVLFLYIIGTVYDRADYLQNKLKILKIDTIALFLIIMKLYVQISKILSKTGLEDYYALQQGWLFIVFMFFTLLVGIYSIFAHKPKKS
ncbi:MAG: hypothetical protein ACFFD5_15700 [Candidatus Thorarchaeota archaeon]